MPVTVECNHSERRLTIVREGALTLEDLVESVVQMRTTNIWSYSVLVDARQASTVLRPVEARALLTKIQAIGDGSARGPIAVVAADDLTFGMVRMFASLAEPVGMRVAAFREVAAAEEWLQQMAAT